MPIEHGGECLDDETTKSVCESLYACKCDEAIALFECVKALYALCGELPLAQTVMQNARRLHHE